MTVKPKTVYQEFIFVSRYAKYLDKEKRREFWQETVKRYLDSIQNLISEKQNFDIEPYLDEIRSAILTCDVMPSMRGLMTAGEALKRDNAAIYNCSYLPIDSFKALDELLYTLMLGTGVGFSVESLYVDNLPQLPEDYHDTNTTIIFEDSRLGWAKGYREYVSLLCAGHTAKWDVSKIRPKGARLKTFGGRSSGPDPLVELLEFTKTIFRKAAGRKLSTLECHDIVCKIAEVVVVGGVRRSALISLSDLNDDKIRDSKSGSWWNANGQRRLANNSAVYTEKPDVGVFLQEWLALYKSKSGERGIVSRKAMQRVVENANEYRRSLNNNHREREVGHDFGVNPCSEIILRPYEFCNLTSVQIYEHDTEKTLIKKIRIASILGTLQSCLTNFKYISKKWQKNCEDERLLGISLNGVFDNNLTNGTGDTANLIKLLEKLKKTAIDTNKEFAEKLGINQSVAITCIKPEGTTSAFNGTSSGLHPAHSPYYIRYVRNSFKDPVTEFLITTGVPWENDYYDKDNTVVFKFPIKSSKEAIFKKDRTAIEHLELWKIYQQHYCEHKPSITVSVKESEWMDVGTWCYNNFEWMSGVSFLSAEENGHSYKQAPFTECTKEEYEELLKEMPLSIDWGQLSNYEKEDQTTSTQDLACVSGYCEV